MLAPALLVFLVARRILILEDDLLLLKQLRRLLGSRGHEVHGTSTVAAFLVASAGMAFDCCLLDLSLPDGNGLDAWAGARATQPAAIAVVMTAHGTGEAHRRAGELGIRAVLPKPFPLPALLAAVGGDAMEITTDTKEEPQ